MARVRVGVDATSWSNGRGFGRHTRSLVRALLRDDEGMQYTLFTDSPARLDGVPAGADLRVVPAARPTTEAATAGSRRRLRDMAAMSRALSDPALDVLLYPTVYSYVPAWSRAKKIVTLHDVTAERFPGLALGGPARRLLWRMKVAVARRQAHVILTHSEFSRQGIVARLGVDPARVCVAGVGADPAFRVLERPAPTPALKAHGLGSDGSLIVYVGGFSPHKRIDVLVDAVSALAARFPDARLVLVGDHERDAFRSCYPAIRAQVRRLGLDPIVSFTGFLPDGDLAVLLNLASVLVLPSMIEGFGLPALEAAACGCPVVATTESPLADALGAAVLSVRPGDRDELAQALARVLGDDRLRAAMRAAGPPAAAGHTWQGAARRVSAVIRDSVRA